MLIDCTVTISIFYVLLPNSRTHGRWPPLARPPITQRLLRLARLGL